MPEQVILCPHCKKEIPLTEALSHQIRGELERQLDAKLKAREELLARKEKQVEASEKGFSERVETALRTEREKLRAELEGKAREDLGVQMKDLAEELAEKTRKLEEAQRGWLEMRKRARELEDRQKELDLEVTRRVDEERKRIQEDLQKRLQEEHRLKEAEKEKLVDGLRRQIDELRRKAEQGSQQMQGEVLELELEEILRAAYPMDRIEPVAKGIRGADLLQKVHDPIGRPCGTIIWESKRTKAWSDGWLQKIKDDQRELKADVAVIMSVVLPRDLKNFGRVDGVWVTDCACAIALAASLRMTILEVACAKTAATGKSEKIEVLYRYLTGHEFRQRVEGILDAFQSMRRDLEKEKAALIRIWAKRESEIARVITSTSGMWGDLQGIIGSALPRIGSLELEHEVECLETGSGAILGEVPLGIDE